MYVFNYLQAGAGYLFRAPEPVARLICGIADRRFGRTWDYAPKPEGLVTMPTAVSPPNRWRRAWAWLRDRIEAHA